MMTTLLQTRRAFTMVLALGLLAMAARSVTDPDVWWHLRTGELILESHSIPRTDPYSFTRFGRPWVTHEWLSEVLLFGLYRLAGMAGLIVAFAAVVGAAFLLVFRRCAGRPYLAALLTLWGAVTSASSWGVRPQMLTLLLASVFLYLLEISAERPRLLWWTPPLMLLWVNLHAGYVIGLVFLAVFLVGEGAEAACHPGTSARQSARLTSLALALGLCIFLAVFNPYGWRIFEYPLETLRSPAMHQFIQEWFSPNFHDPADWLLLLALVALLAGLAFSSTPIRLRDFLLLFITVPAALRSVRHIPILMLVLIPILSHLAEAGLRGRGAARFLFPEQSSRAGQPKPINAVVLAAFVIFSVTRVVQVVRTQSLAEAKHFPVSAIAFLEQHPAGPLLNHYNWGGYLIWKLYPGERVFIDGRADVYGDSFLTSFGATYFLSGDWRQPLRQYEIRTLLLPPDAPLITALAGHPGWKRVYADSSAVVLTRVQ